MRRSYIFLLVIPFLWNCSEPKSWMDVKDNIPPGIVTDIQVENINGGAIITYKLPSDNDLLGVKAVYRFHENDEARETYSSSYMDTIRIEGYPNTAEHLVHLYTIDISRNLSEPVEVKIQPLIPPVQLIRKTLKVNSTFGGVYTLWENAVKDEIAISLYVEDEYGDMVLYDSYYSNATNGKFAFRGLKDISQSFRVEIRDKWGNYSTPKDTVLTPLFEEEIVGKDDKIGNIWKRYGWEDGTSLYRGDFLYELNSGNRAFNCIFDGRTFVNDNWWHSGDGGNNLGYFVPGPGHESIFLFPIYFTIDMGRKASYSRLRHWMRSRTPYFSATVFTHFEVWATNDPKPVSQIGDGSQADNLKYWTQWPEVGGTDEWKNDWTMLGDFVLTLPSGETDPNLLTNEDREFIAAGFEFELDPQYADTPFRYLRFALKKNNGTNAQIQLAELKFWGAYED